MHDRALPVRRQVLLGTLGNDREVLVAPPGVLLTENILCKGGFAHVYLVRLSKPVNNTDIAVLKRVAVPDKEALGTMRTEVDTMV